MHKETREELRVRLKLHISPVRKFLNGQAPNGNPFPLFSILLRYENVKHY
jgi:hypothetical protein